MDVTLSFILALLGIAVGSFLNLCSDRLPRGKSLIRPPSHCDACQRRLSPKDLIPVISYLWLKGRCRHCGAPITRRQLWVEVGVGLLFVLLYWHYGLTGQLAITMFYSGVFVLIMVIDLERGLILNRVVYPAAIAAVVANIFYPPAGIFHISLPYPEVARGISGVVNSLIGGAVGFAFLMIPAVISPRGMGWGDVKMAALIGLVVGFPLVIIALFLGIIAGGLAAGLLLALKRKGRKEAIPFGPFLSLATIATLLWGSATLDWYLSLF